MGSVHRRGNKSETARPDDIRSSIPFFCRFCNYGHIALLVRTEILRQRLDGGFVISTAFTQYLLDPAQPPEPLLFAFESVSHADLDQLCAMAVGPSPLGRSHVCRRGVDLVSDRLRYFLASDCSLVHQ